MLQPMYLFQIVRPGIRPRTASGSSGKLRGKEAGRQGASLVLDQSDGTRLKCAQRSEAAADRVPDV